jgi:hypothetical protein
MTQKNKSLLAVCIGCFAAAIAMAQQFKFTAALDSVVKTGFYQVSITPQLSSYVKTDFSDLRISDEKGNWVPHIIQTVLPFMNQSALKEFPIVSNQLNDSGKTELVVENKGIDLHIGNTAVLTVSEIVLFIKNNAVSRYAAISGSNDGKHWYIINENILLARSYESDSSYFISSVKFSNADYKYFKLVIDNAKSDPLNILKAGSYFNLTFQSVISSVSNPPAVISQKDSSDGRSYIKVRQDAAYHIDKIRIDAAGAKFFKRNAVLLLPGNDSTVAHRHEPGLSFVLSSGSDNEFSLEKIKTTFFYIIIENNDNPPLQIKAVNTSQSITRAVAWLEAGKKYSLLVDNADAEQPDYDIALFKDSIPANAPAIGIGTFKKTEPAAVAEQKNDNNKWWLWPAIIGAIAILGFLSWKLLADMKKTDA